MQTEHCRCGTRSWMRTTLLCDYDSARTSGGVRLHARVEYEWLCPCQMCDRLTQSLDSRLADTNYIKHAFYFEHIIYLLAIPFLMLVPRLLYPLGFRISGGLPTLEPEDQAELMQSCSSLGEVAQNKVVPEPVDDVTTQDESLPNPADQAGRLYALWDAYI